MQTIYSIVCQCPCNSVKPTLLTGSPLCPASPGAPTGPGVPGAPVEPGRPAGPGSPRSPWWEQPWCYSFNIYPKTPTFSMFILFTKWKVCILLHVLLYKLYLNLLIYHIEENETLSPKFHSSYPLSPPPGCPLHQGYWGGRKVTSRPEHLSPTSSHQAECLCVFPTNVKTRRFLREPNPRFSTLYVFSRKLLSTTTLITILLSFCEKKK